MISSLAPRGKSFGVLCQCFSLFHQFSCRQCTISSTDSFSALIIFRVTFIVHHPHPTTRRFHYITHSRRRNCLSIIVKARNLSHKNLIYLPHRNSSRNFDSLQKRFIAAIGRDPSSLPGLRVSLRPSSCVVTSHEFK